MSLSVFPLPMTKPIFKLIETLLGTRWFCLVFEGANTGLWIAGTYAAALLGCVKTSPEKKQKSEAAQDWPGLEYGPSFGKTMARSS